MEELLGDRDHVLLALDGPLAELPPVGQAAERLRVMVADGKLPRKVARTDDPFVVLAHAATIGPGTERAVHAQLSRFEHERLVGAPVTAGAIEALAAMAAAGTQVTVLSSFAVEPVRSFLLLHGLDEHVKHLVARTGPDRTVLPPAPDLVTAAIHARAFPVESCLFIGSTDTDLAAAEAAGVDAVRFRRRATETPEPWFESLSPLVKRR